MISSNVAIAAVCAALLVAGGLVWTVYRFWLVPDAYERGYADAWDEAEEEAPTEALRPVRAPAAPALAPAVHPAGVIAGEVTESFDWAPTDRLEAWTHTGAPPYEQCVTDDHGECVRWAHDHYAPRTPGRERGEVRAPARGPAAPPATRPGGPPEPLRVILARFREDLDASTAEFDRHMDELVAA